MRHLTFIINMSLFASISNSLKNCLIFLLNTNVLVLINKKYQFRQIAINTKIAKHFLTAYKCKQRRWERTDLFEQSSEMKLLATFLLFVLAVGIVNATDCNTCGSGSVTSSSSCTCDESQEFYQRYVAVLGGYCCQYLPKTTPQPYTDGYPKGDQDARR